MPARLPAACGDKNSDVRYLQLRDAPQDPFSPRNYTGGTPRHQVGVLASRLEAALSPGPVPVMFSPQADTADILKMAGIRRPSPSPSSSPTPLSTDCNNAAGLPDNASEEDMEQCSPPSLPLPPFPDQDCASVPDTPFSPPAPECFTLLESPQGQ